MPRRTQLVAHLSCDQLHQHYRQAQDPVERSQFQILWLIALGQTTRQVQSVTGYCLDWIQKLVRRYNQKGPQAMGDKRRLLPGATPLLSDVQQAQLLIALQTPPSDGGLWNGPKVAVWMGELLGRPVAPQRGWEYLRALEQSLRVPRARHRQADPIAEEAFKKTTNPTS